MAATSLLLLAVGFRGRGGDGEGEALKRAVNLGIEFIIKPIAVKNSFSKVCRVENSFTPLCLSVILNGRGVDASQVSPSLLRAEEFPSIGPRERKARIGYRGVMGVTRIDFPCREREISCNVTLDCKL